MKTTVFMMKMILIVILVNGCDDNDKSTDAGSSAQNAGKYSGLLDAGSSVDAATKPDASISVCGETQCNANAHCETDTEGKSTCQCNDGYFGDGITCSDMGHWKRHTIGQLNAAIYVSTFDMDGDGDLDMIATGNNIGEQEYPSEIVWFENNISSNEANWERHVIWSALDSGTLHSANGVDVSAGADGKHYIVIGTGERESDRGGVYLLRPKTTDTHADWEALELLYLDGASEDTKEGFWKAYFVDANGDDHLDVVAGGSLAARLFINPGDSDKVWDKAEWKMHRMGPGTGTSIYVGDVDGDNKDDIVHSNYNTKTIMWSSIEVDPSTQDITITDRPVAENIEFAFDVNLIDIDQDGIKEIVYSALYQEGIFYYHSTNPLEGPWIQGVIDSTYMGTDIFVIDVNGDGKNDVAAGSFGLPSGSPKPQIAWFKGGVTTDLNTTWEKYLIDFNTCPTAADIEFCDLDKDGDNDLVTGSMKDNNIYWYENQMD